MTKYDLRQQISQCGLNNAAVIRRLEISNATLYSWLKGTKPIPAHWWIPIHETLWYPPKNKTRESLWPAPPKPTAPIPPMPVLPAGYRTKPIKRAKK